MTDTRKQMYMHGLVDIHISPLSAEKANKQWYHSNEYI